MASIQNDTIKNILIEKDNTDTMAHNSTDQQADEITMEQ